MRLRNVKNAQEILNNSKYVIKNPKEYQKKFNELFENNNPIHLEIGMGKGQFIINMALKYPNINFIGVEKYQSVLVRAVQKLETIDIPNLKLICCDAKELNEIFDHEIETIYLNFSDPWPKKRHSNRRLTSHIFLKIYDNIFKDKKIIIQKTDNIILFASSISSLSTYGYTLEEVSLDLHNENIDNVKTEYEEKFSGQGYKINYLKAVKK
jgi:tRNA (guanine-N7-)-methyltransferase